MVSEFRNDYDIFLKIVPEISQMNENDLGSVDET